MFSAIRGRTRRGSRWKEKKSEIAVTVRDDGVGVPDEIAEFRPDSIGVGIGGMRQRIKEFGGELLLRKAQPGYDRRGRDSRPVTYPSDVRVVSVTAR